MTIGHQTIQMIRMGSLRKNRWRPQQAGRENGAISSRWLDRNMKYGIIKRCIEKMRILSQNNIIGLNFFLRLLFKSISGS